MDLHYTENMPDEAERAAVDELLTASSSLRIGEDTDSEARHDVDYGSRIHRNRHLLLPLLHALQDRIGWISPGALNYVCRRLQTPPAEAYGVASFYALFSLEKQPPTVLHVCDDIACKARGADALCAQLETDFGPSGSTRAEARAAWKRSPCLGLCEKAPAVFCQNAGDERLSYTHAPADAKSILTALDGEPMTMRVPGGSAPQRGTSGLTLLARVGTGDPESLDDYHAHGGYRALRRAFDLGPSEVIREVTEAALAGRGGAAFPTGTKWKAVSEAPVRPHYVVCNADESEPGTFKDRVVMEEDPFAVIEAMTIAGFACGAERGYLYIRGEYPEAERRLRHAIAESVKRGYLGENILGRGVRFDIEIRRGAGAYICGEETALLESIEGKRGEPRNKPPYPVQVGLFGKPTAINNVETLVNVLPILVSGHAAYAAIGSGRSTGTRLFCLSGCVERPGVYELPYGATLGELIALGGGVPAGRELKAILLGGAAGVFVDASALSMPLTLEGARAAGATLGSGVVMVFDDSIDMGRILLRIAAFFRDESCGQCVPCRVGTVRQEEALNRLAARIGSAERDLMLLDELDRVMRDASICGLGQAAASAVMSGIRCMRPFEGGIQ